MQLSLNLTKLCHNKRNHPANFSLFTFHYMGQLYWCHHKGWMATKFTRTQSIWLSCVKWSKLHSKPETILELKSAL